MSDLAYNHFIYEIDKHNVVYEIVKNSKEIHIPVTRLKTKLNKKGKYYNKVRKIVFNFVNETTLNISFLCRIKRDYRNFWLYIDKDSYINTLNIIIKILTDRDSRTKSCIFKIIRNSYRVKINGGRVTDVGSRLIIKDDNSIEFDTTYRLYVDRLETIY